MTARSVLTWQHSQFQSREVDFPKHRLRCPRTRHPVVEFGSWAGQRRTALFDENANRLRRFLGWYRLRNESAQGSRLAFARLLAGFLPGGPTLRHLLTLLAGFREPDGDRLLATLHRAALATLAAFQLALLAPAHGALHVFLALREYF